MKGLKLGIVILQGIAAVIEVGIGVYQVVKIVKEENALKDATGRIDPEKVVNVEVAKAN